MGDGSSQCEECGYSSKKGKRKQRREDEDSAWRREISMEAGMLHGVDAYNDAMGYSLDHLD